ncbi:MAG: DUF721 domain-containing protein [Candidatus Kryptoniota bacterium]
MHEAKQLHKIIEEFISSSPAGRRLKAYRVITDWNNIVGDLIAKNTDIVRVDAGILYVRVKTPTWRNELVFQKSKILDKIREDYRDSEITDIFFI